MIAPFSLYPSVVPSAGPCYVLGCLQPTDEAPTEHRAFGPVRTCTGHHPSRDARSAAPSIHAGIEEAFDAADAIGEGPDDDEHRDGGVRVPAVPTPPTTPPSDGAALTPPTTQAPRLPAGVRAF